MSQGEVFSKLKYVDLHNTSVDDVGVDFFLKSPNSSQLEHLNVSMNWSRITDYTLYALAVSDYCKNLKFLDLSDCCVTDKGIGEVTSS